VTADPRVFSVDLPPGAEAAPRVDIEVSGLDLAGPSFELRAFVGNPGAGATTAPTPENGYAGSIHVYGYDGAHPGLSESESRPRLAMTRSIVATDPVRRASADANVAITLVPVAYGDEQPDADLGAVSVALLADDGPAL
jgi:hypothetical protein